MLSTVVSNETLKKINLFEPPEWLGIDKEHELPKEISQILRIMSNIESVCESKGYIGENKEINFESLTCLTSLYEAIGRYKNLLKEENQELKRDLESSFRNVVAFHVFGARQTREDGSLYLGHLVGVSLIVRELGGGIPEQTIALLHDILEDTFARDMNEGAGLNIERLYGEKVSNAVAELTFEYGEAEARTIIIRRKIEKYSTFNESEALVKFSDIIFNLLTKLNPSAQYINERISFLKAIKPNLPSGCESTYNFFVERLQQSLVELNKKN